MTKHNKYPPIIFSENSTYSWSHDETTKTTVLLPFVVRLRDGVGIQMTLMIVFAVNNAHGLYESVRIRNMLFGNSECEF